MNTDLSSLPSNGLEGSGSLFNVLQPFRPFTDASAAEACKIIEGNATPDLQLLIFKTLSEECTSTNEIKLKVAVSYMEVSMQRRAKRERLLVCIGDGQIGG